MTQMTKNLCAGLEMAATASGLGSGARQEQIGEQAAYGATIRRFLEISRAYLALLHTSGSTRAVQHHSSEVCVFPQQGAATLSNNNHSLGDEHVVR